MTVLNVHDLGDPSGRAVLAIHGITAHGLRFRRLAEEAWPNRRTLAVDLRGHGRSTSDGPWSVPQHVRDLLDTLDAFGYETIDVVGHSYGGAIGLALLAAAPERVERLVLLDPALAETGVWSTTMATDTIEQRPFVSIDQASSARNQGLAGWASGDPIAPCVVEDVEQHLMRDDDGTFRFRFHKPAAVTGWGEMSSALPTTIDPRPALLVIAERAALVTPEVEADLVTLFDGQLDVTRIDCGHMLYWERFDETAAAVQNFWNR